MVKRPAFRRALVAGLLACATIASASAAGPAPAQRAATPGFVEWLRPTAEPARPQTDAEKELGRTQGRVLPQREVLQPSLDPALPAYVPKRKLSGTFRGGSSDVLVGLVHLWFERFRAHHPGVTLEIVPPFAGSLGTKELIGGKADFVFVSRELKPEDLTEFSAKFGYLPTSVPISGGSWRHFGFLDAIGVFVHPDNPITQLDFRQLDAIFSSTHHRGGKTIRTWGELGLTGEWADKPVHVHGVAPWNGFEEFVRQRVLDHGGKRGEWREDAYYEKLVFPLAANVAADRYAIGYSGLAYLDAPVKVLPLAVAPGTPAISASYEDVALARYPLSRLVYFNVDKAPGEPLPEVLDELLRFILSRDGQQVVLDHGIFLPLRAQQLEVGTAVLAP